MAVSPRVVIKRRATITDLPLYHHGTLKKKYSGEKNFKTFYAELRGSTIFLYTNEMQDTYIERLDLEMLKTITMESPYSKKTPIIYRLTLQNEEVQLKMDCLDKGEEWRRLILTVSMKEIPTLLQLLPGQILILEDILAQEKRRLRPSIPLRKHPSSSTIGGAHDNSGIPSCFFDVTRMKAEQMLKENPSYGSIILRPSTAGYALTLRQDNPSGPVLKNYRVLSAESGFTIELEPSVTVSSLKEVLEYFLFETKYRLHPYTPPQIYDTRIEVPPLPPLNRAAKPHARIAPMIQTQELSDDDTPPTRPPPRVPNEASVEDEGDYIDLDAKPRRDTRPQKVDEELRTVLEKRRAKMK